MSTETTVTDRDHDMHPRYTDKSYPGHPEYINAYYEVSFRGIAGQFEKYRTLKVALLDAVEYCLNLDGPLSSQIRDLRTWALHDVNGFTKQHMPWGILIDAELYKPFAYVLTKHDTYASRRAYQTIRRYGEWV